LSEWTGFFQGALSAAAALAGLLFLSVSVNQARILELGRMADRGLEALAMLMLALIVASLPLIPGQPPLVLGAEILVTGAATLVALVYLQQAYLRELEPIHRSRAMRMVWINRLAIGIIAGAGLALIWWDDTTGLYMLAPGILLTFAAAGANAWVLLIEINR
jgi:hypothetical protein